MKRLFTLFFFISLFEYSWSQNIMFTPEETGMMFHVVQKSNALKRTIGEHFQYRGDTVFFEYSVKGEKKMEIDYDSIAKKILFEPSLLKIDFYSLSEESTGILAELASKMALYKLYKDLKSRKTEIPNGIKESSFQKYLDTLILNLPPEVIRKRNGKDEPTNEMWELLDPNKFFNQRTAALSTMQGLKTVKQKEVMDAINRSVWSYLQFKSEDYFNKLSRQSRGFTTTLIACGDGSNTSGLLDEREKIYKQTNELGDAVGLGLFTYESQFVTNSNNRQILTPNASTMINLNALPNDYTNVHFSLWGFNSFNQTTVALYNMGNMYLLYGNKLTKELSPDSTFGKGTTIHSAIRKLEMETIPQQDFLINGEDGIRARLNSKDTSHKDVMYQIAQTEMNLTNYRYDAMKNKKKIKSDENLLAKLYTRKASLEKQRAALLAQLREEEERLARFIARLNELKSYLGYQQINYTKFGYVYTFTDGCTFNTFTQNFTIPDSLQSDKFDIRLIAIGMDAMSESLDEVQLLTSVSKGKPEDFNTHPVSLEFNDIFKVDDYDLKPIQFNDEQLFELTKLVYEMLRSKTKLSFDLKGQGIGVLVDGKVVPSSIKEMDAYPGETEEERKLSKESEEFKPLRYSRLNFKLSENNLMLSVESFTDPVKSNFSKKHEEIATLKKSFKINPTDNLLLSAFRTFYMTELFTKELLKAAYFNFEGKDRNKLIEDITAACIHSKCSIGEQWITYKQFTTIAHGKEDFIQKCLDEFKLKEEENRKVFEM
jgi:hypothetical protein